MVLADLLLDLRTAYGPGGSDAVARDAATYFVFPPCDAFAAVRLSPEEWPAGRWLRFGLPTWLVLTGGLLGTVASVTLVSGGILSIPGLFLLGLAVARLGIAHTLDRRTGQLAAVLALAAPAAAAAVWCQHTYSSLGPFATRIAAEAGLLGALTYATALLLLLRTPLGRTLSAVLEPLGRMALTNYITATLAITAASPLLGLKDSGRWGTAMLLAAGIIAVQAPFSHWWLRRFRYGPLEWCLRCVTWWSIVPIARSRVAAA